MKTRDRLMEKLLKAVYRKDIAEIRTLLANGSDLNCVDPDGRTLLMHAVLDSEPDGQTLELLIHDGIDVNYQDKIQKWSALHFAARDNKKEPTTILLKAGANVHLRDIFGNTPLWRAVMAYNKDNSIIIDLLNHGSNPNDENNCGVSPRTLATTLGKTELLKLLC